VPVAVAGAAAGGGRVECGVPSRATSPRRTSPSTAWTCWAGKPYVIGDCERSASGLPSRNPSARMWDNDSCFGPRRRTSGVTRRVTSRVISSTAAATRRPTVWPSRYDSAAPLFRNDT